MAEESVKVQMVRQDLENIPEYPLPAGYEFRWYEPGFERHWQEIHRLADLHTEMGSDLFVKQFSLDERILRRRQCYLVDSSERFIGTATAWLDDDLMGQPFGLLHWVAVAAEFQGRGLAKPLVSTVLQRMGKLGHRRAYLNTQTLRIPAINLYAVFGFEPLIRNDGDLRAWSGIQSKLKRQFELQEPARGADY